MLDDIKSTEKLFKSFFRMFQMHEWFPLQTTQSPDFPIRNITHEQQKGLVRPTL